MRRIAREEPRVPVPRAEQRDKPKHTDEQLVAREARSAPRERVHLGLEALPRDAPKRVRVNLLDRSAELANVVGGRRRERTDEPAPRRRTRPWRVARGAGPASAWPGMMSYRYLHVKIDILDGASLRTPRRARRPAANRATRCSSTSSSRSRTPGRRATARSTPSSRGSSRTGSSSRRARARATRRRTRSPRRGSTRSAAGCARRAGPPRPQRCRAANVLPLAPRAGRGGEQLEGERAYWQGVLDEFLRIRDEPTGHNKKARTFRIALEGGIRTVEARLAWLESHRRDPLARSGRGSTRADAQRSASHAATAQALTERARRWYTCRPVSSAKPSAPWTWCALAVTSQHAVPAQRSSPSWRPPSFVAAAHASSVIASVASAASARRDCTAGKRRERRAELLARARVLDGELERARREPGEVRERRRVPRAPACSGRDRLELAERARRRRARCRFRRAWAPAGLGRRRAEREAAATARHRERRALARRGARGRRPRAALRASPRRRGRRAQPRARARSRRRRSRRAAPLRPRARPSPPRRDAQRARRRGRPATPRAPARAAAASRRSQRARTRRRARAPSETSKLTRALRARRPVSRAERRCGGRRRAPRRRRE